LHILPVARAYPPHVSLAHRGRIIHQAAGTCCIAPSAGTAKTRSWRIEINSPCRETHAWAVPLEWIGGQERIRLQERASSVRRLKLTEAGGPRTFDEDDVTLLEQIHLSVFLPSPWGGKIKGTKKGPCWRGGQI
jgi:hypothetical protein